MGNVISHHRRGLTPPHHSHAKKPKIKEQLLFTHLLFDILAPEIIINTSTFLEAPTAFQLLQVLPEGI